MNSADVIRKISKKAGIPDTETKKFFEIFLQQTSSVLNPGESIKIPGVGSFQLRLGQIENSTGKTERQFIYSNLIVFIGEDDQAPEEEEIIFNVPEALEEEYQSIDSYFSLSIGKPIIPLKGVKAAEFFIPPSGPELRGLFESKVSRLLEEAVKITGGKETEIILLKPGKSSVDVEPVEEELPVHSDFLKTREFENLSWDFGETLSQEIEEKTTGEFKEEPKEIKKVSAKGKEEAPHFEEEDSSPEHPYEEIFEEVADEETEWMRPEFEPEGRLVSEPEQESEGEPQGKPEGEPEDKPEGEPERKYEGDIEVTPEDVSEVEIEKELKDSDFEDMFVEETEDIKPPEVEIEDKESGEIIQEEMAKEELSLKNFQRVSSLTKEFNISVGEEKKEETSAEKSHPKITEVRGGFQKVRRTTAEFNFDFSGMKGLDEEEQVSGRGEKSISSSYKGYRKSVIPSLVIAAVVIIALAGIIYLYLNLKNENDKTDTTKPQTKVIERNYDVPVTYPYDSTNETNPADNKNEAPVKNENTSPGVSNSIQSEITESVNAERIENYIYQYPEGIVVQVSSWKSKSIAVSEVKKYRDAGYKAFAEMSTIPGMGLYYRVRVGYFKTLNEAKEFANGNQ